MRVTIPLRVQQRSCLLLRVTQKAVVAQAKGWIRARATLCIRVPPKRIIFQRTIIILFGSRAHERKADELSAAFCSSFQLKSPPGEVKEPSVRVTIPLRAQQRSCLLLPRAVLHFRTLPPRAKVPNLFASRAFGQIRDAPNRRDLPRTQTRLTQYARYCAGRCSLSRCLRHEGCRTAVCAYGPAPL